MPDSELSALDLAYELAVDSYDPLLKRLDALDGRLQTMMGFAATTMAIVTTVASARHLSFRSLWFWAGFVMFLVIVAAGTHARHSGGNIALNDPGKFLDDDWQSLDPPHFKKFFIEYAGEHWNANNALVTWKWKRSVAISIGFFIQVAFLVVWVADQRA